MAEEGDTDECHVHVMIEALQRELACVKVRVGPVSLTLGLFPL